MTLTSAEPAAASGADQATAAQPAVRTGPARRPLTERRMARTRRELADAAGRLFVEKGYDATTVEDIVAEVEISARTFFRYFGSKEEVVATLWRYGIDEIVDELRAVPADKPLLEAVRAAAGAQCRHAVDNPASTRSFIRMVRETPALHARRMQEAYGQQQILAECIGERIGRPAGDLRVTLIAGAVVMAFSTAFDRWADTAPAVGDPGPAPLVDKALAELSTPLLPV